MATINELFDSQPATTGASNASVDLTYIIQDASEYSDAITILVATAPRRRTITVTSSVWEAAADYGLGERVASTGTVNTFVCTTAGTSGGTEPTWNTAIDATTNDNTAVWTRIANVETISLQDLEVSALGCDNWNGVATYSRVSNDNSRDQTIGESYFNFEVSGQNQHITHSLSTTQTLGTAPGQGGAIRVSGSGAAKKIDGTDILFPTASFSETHHIADSSVTTAYKKLVLNMATKTNDAIFRDFAVGEVLFLGANGTQRGSGDWEITYKFGIRQNDATFSVTDIAGDVPKKGWEFAWVISRKETSAGVGVIMKPTGAYIEQIYEAGDFTTLGI